MLVMLGILDCATNDNYPWAALSEDLREFKSKRQCIKNRAKRLSSINTAGRRCGGFSGFHAWIALCCFLVSLILWFCFQLRVLQLSNQLENFLATHLCELSVLVFFSFKRNSSTAGSIWKLNLKYYGYTIWGNIAVLLAESSLKAK